jgi:predicted phage baseplate assembly protein
MSLFADTSCGCGPPPHPETAPIPAGLGALSMRQRSGFPEYREALLEGVGRQEALAGWRARGLGDLGVMVIEAWAYVLDVTAFYDARIAERAYLRTAPDAAALQGLVSLLGYQPRGAVAATVRVAVTVGGADPVPIRKGVAFRSEAVDDEPPQVFEVDADTTAWPQRNRWQLAPVRPANFDGTLRFGPRDAPPAGAVVRLDSGSTAVAARVLKVASETAQDGANYQRLLLGAGSVAALTGLPMASLSVSILRLALAPNAFAPRDPTNATTAGMVVLDQLYPQLLANSRAVVEIAGILTPVTITATSSVTLTIDSTSGARVTATKVTLAPAVSWPTDASLVLHTMPFSIPAPQQPAKTAITLTDVMGDGALVAPIEPLGDAQAGGTVLLVGARAEGVALDGTIVELGQGEARFQAMAGAPDFVAPLVRPVALWGNTIVAVRGETVRDEVLGSGNPAMPWNSFKLKKSPLAWREDSGSPTGRRPELTVHVNGVRWTRVDSFFGQSHEAEIYTVRTLANGDSEIRFGDGKRGARPPGGVDNIRAEYRFGAGVATPPPGAINQIANRQKLLEAVIGPLAASGGADREGPEVLRSAAPASALTLGRAVSPLDFEALARGYSGVVNAVAGWAWDARRQMAVVTLWVIATGADPTPALTAWLLGQAIPGLGLVVTPAAPATATSLVVELVIDPRFDPGPVREAAFAALFDPDAGLLAPGRQQIGSPLFRSAVVATLHAVAGVTAVASIRLDGQQMPRAVAPGQGRWFDLAAGSLVS